MLSIQLATTQSWAGSAMRKARWMSVLLWLLCCSVSVAEDTVKVLMLGDSGFHKPSEFYRSVRDSLKQSSIELAYTEKLSDINTENLKSYAGLLIFANIERITPEAETALLSYVENGGGLIPVHCASFCFLNSDKYIALVGGQFKRHGFTRFQTKIVASDHEIMQGLSPISSEDESYMHARHNPDRIVLETRSDASGPVSDPAGEPYTWIRQVGKGRVFYTAWGHDHRTWSNTSFQQLLARGTRWACHASLSVVATVDTAKRPADPTALAVEQANRAFPTPEMTKPSIVEKAFTFTDVGAKIPNYTAGQRWGTQGAPLTEMQNPLPAESSINGYSVPSGFAMSLWAKESNEFWPSESRANDQIAGLKGKPIAMTWDERGRLWVCETIDYPNELQPIGQGRDRIKICEDTDNDGRADKFTVFAEHLSIPSTMVCYRGGVLVQDGQSTVYLKDIDGDDVADFRQVLITGWALGDTHGGVSNFQYGPDNWIWAMQGYNNSEPVINGKAQMRFRQGFWRYKVRAGASDNTAPAYAIDKQTKQTETKNTDQFDSHTIRVDALEFVRQTNNNTWGLGFSEEGYVFGSTANGCPSVHMPIPNRYYDQVAGWSPKTLEKISPTNNFKAIDNQIRQVDNHGGYTAACGAALYTARNYPNPWWNKVSMVCEPTGHLVGAFVLEKQGAGYRSENSFNTVASIDDWAAPIMSEVGPDGNVWVLDWYNYIVQHNPTPNGFKTGKGAAYESDLRDKRYGRVYRLLYQAGSKGSSVSHSMQLTADTKPAQLIEALKDSNFFWRRTAQRLLVERNVADQASLDALVALVSESKMDDIGLAPGALHAIWTLAGLDDASSDKGNSLVRQALRAACEKGMAHPSSPVRAAAVAYCADDQVEKAFALKLATDVDPRVRLAVLLRTADTQENATPSGKSLSALMDPANGLASDDILLDAWVSAASRRPVDTLVALSNDQSGDVSRTLVARVGVLAEHIARSQPKADTIERLLAIAPNSPLAVPVWEGLARGWPKDLTLTLSESAQQSFRERYLAESTSVQCKAAILSVADKWSIKDLQQSVASIQDRLMTVALNTEETSANRIVAWEQAIRLLPDSPRIVTAVEGLFTPQLSPELGNQALDALQTARAEGLAAKLLEVRKRVGPTLASGILRVLLGRADTTAKLLDAIEQGSVQIAELQLDQRQAMLNHPDRALANRANELMKARGAMVASNRQSLVDQWMPVTEMQGDMQNGIAVYKKHCGQCHKHGEIGNAIGPNLTGMAVHPKEEILMNVLDPSRSVEGNFRTYQILTTTGTVLNGMLAGESANAITLINTQGKEEQVLRADIERMNASTKSLMPEGFEGSISRQEMADLLTFLNHRSRYTPLSLSGAATVSGAKGLPGFRQGPPDKFVLKSYGKIEVDGVPFELVDPQDGRTANIIAIQSRQGRRGPGGPGAGAGPGQGPRGGAQASLPDTVSLPCAGSIKSIHLLGGVAAAAFPFNREPTSSIIVRCHFKDGTSKDYPLINGKHIAGYRERTDVPDSKFALDADGKQIRYLKIDVDSSKEMTSIDFVKGEDGTIPLVFGVTVEAPTIDNPRAGAANKQPDNASTAMSSISGKWLGTIDTQIGKQEYEYTFKVENGRLIGQAVMKLAGETHKSQLTDVALNGESIAFVETLNFQGNDLRITYTGEVRNGRAMLTRKVGDFATETFVATLAR